MAIQLSCPKCDNRVSLSDDWAGKRLKCRCGEMVEVPPAEPVPAIQTATSRPTAPPTPYLDAAAARSSRPRRRYDDEPDRHASSESILPWILAGGAVVVVLLLLLGGGMIWALLAWRSGPARVEDFGPEPVLRHNDAAQENAKERRFDQEELELRRELERIKEELVEERARLDLKEEGEFPRRKDLEQFLAKELKANDQQGLLARDSAFWTALGRSVAAGQFHKSEALFGNWGQAPFADSPSEGRLLIGFYYTTRGPVMDFVQPIYFTAVGEKLGPAYGMTHQRPSSVRAKDGYAVGAITVRAGDLFDGMQITFMKVAPDMLNSKDAYDSAWLGGQGGDPYRVGGEGRLIVGIHGRLVDRSDVHRGNIASLGVLTLK